jgi:hypothetical protein
VFIGQRIFNAELSIPVVAFDCNLRLLWLAWTRRWNQLVNGTREDGPWLFSNSRRVSELSSAIFADLDIRGFAISARTPTSILLLVSFLCLLLFMDSFREIQ